MIGLSLAVIGQVYQTGADSYLLFLIWTLLILPWLYRPNIGIFALITLCLVAVIFAIIGAIKANNKEIFNYPLSITFIK